MRNDFDNYKFSIFVVNLFQLWSKVSKQGLDPVMTHFICVAGSFVVLILEHLCFLFICRLPEIYVALIFFRINFAFGSEAPWWDY